MLQWRRGLKRQLRLYQRRAQDKIFCPVLSFIASRCPARQDQNPSCVLQDRTGLQDGRSSCYVLISALYTRNISSELTIDAFVLRVSIAYQSWFIPTLTQQIFSWYTKRERKFQSGFDDVKRKMHDFDFHTVLFRFLVSNLYLSNKSI